MSLRQQIIDAFRARPLPAEAVELPELGLTVYARTMTAAELFDLKEWWRQGVAKDAEPSDRDLSLKSIVFTIVAGDGKPVFRREDLDELATFPAEVIARMWLAAARLNGMTAAEQESILKNSKAASEESSLTSPQSSAVPSANCLLASTPMN